MTTPKPERTGYRRVMLQLGGHKFGGGKVGIH
ncbi:MAG: UMP kinase, partial [Corynebacterium flavescens]|nr:UMP kinase [Corynebacterium flavescens]